MNFSISEILCDGALKKVFFIKKLSLVLAILFSPTLSFANNHQLLRKDLGKNAEIEYYLSQLSLEQKISQLLIFGFAGKKYNQSMGPRLRSSNPGGMIVFQRNVKNPWALAKMNFEAQKEAIRSTGLPLLIMIDQEGGQVTRIKTKPPAPSAMAMGQTGNPQLVESIGYVTGRILDLAGVNLNLAPVMDLTDPNEKTFIGNRSFGVSPVHVSTMAQAFSKGLSNAGVIPAAKHFPGHGGISQDSHKGSTIKRESLEDIKNKDLIPFQNFAKDNPLSAVMVAHVSYPELDSSLQPATYSKQIVTNLLRDQMGYSGIVITDDLEMLGAAKAGSIEERALKAIEAGVDMIMIAWSRKKQTRAKKSLMKAIQSGRISESRVNDSVRRIIRIKLALKKSLVLSKEDLISRKRQMDFYTEELKQLSNKVTKINFEKSTKKMALVKTPLPEKLDPYIFSADIAFFNSFKKNFNGKTNFIPISRKFDGNVYGYLSKNPNRIAIFYTTGSLSAKFVNRIHHSVRDRVFVVNSTYPGTIVDQNSFAGVFNVNTKNYMSGKWVAEYLIYEHQRNRGPAGSGDSFASKRSH